MSGTEGAEALSGEGQDAPAPPPKIRGDLLWAMADLTRIAGAVTSPADRFGNVTIHDAQGLADRLITCADHIKAFLEAHDGGRDVRISALEGRLALLEARLRQTTAGSST